MKIAVIGANPANIEEIVHVVRESLAGAIEIETGTVDHFMHLTGADLYVCLINRQEQMEKFFGSEKVIALEFVPPFEYFLALSKIPAGTNVLLFNNSLAGTTVLRSRLQKYDLMHLHYDIVAYDEMDFATVASKVAAARLITGGISYVGPGKDLYQKFGSYISEDTAVLVSPPRIATSVSLSRLCHAFSRIQHEAVLDELKRLASIDYLTQLANRRTFDEVLSREWNRARREKTTLSVAMLDLDFFKHYNDHYGHTAGDECLRLIARALQKPLRRPADFCARYGGEEFAVILPNTGPDGTLKILEDIRRAVMSLPICQESSPAASTITVSIGYTSIIPTASITPDMAINTADQALYKAKLQGRNRIVFHAPSYDRSDP